MLDEGVFEFRQDKTVVDLDGEKIGSIESATGGERTAGASETISHTATTGRAATGPGVKAATVKAGAPSSLTGDPGDQQGLTRSDDVPSVERGPHELVRLRNRVRPRGLGQPAGTDQELLHREAVSPERVTDELRDAVPTETTPPARDEPVLEDTPVSETGPAEERAAT